MKKPKIYYLSTCDTCSRIMQEIGWSDAFDKQDIKTESITAEQLDGMAAKTGSYEALFSKVARKYRGEGLNNMALKEEDYRRYILEEYTFLKRPVIVLGDELFVGNSPKNVAAAKQALASYIQQ